MDFFLALWAFGPEGYPPSGDGYRPSGPMVRLIEGLWAFD